jgi:hypothetical protein
MIFFGNFFGACWRALEQKILVYMLSIWNILRILWPFGIICGHWAYSSLFGLLFQEKSGSPAHRRFSKQQVYET